MIFAEIQTAQDFSVTTYHVNGNKDRSFYPEGQTRYLHDGTVTFSENFPERNAEFYGTLSYRITDDQTVDIEDSSIEQMVMGYRNNEIDLIMGDSFAYFSDYSVNNSIKGVRLELKTQNHSKFLFLGGTETANWDNLWEKRKDDGNSQRYVWGARLEKLFANKALAIGVNYGGAYDDKAYFLTTDTYKDIHVGSIDFNYQITPAFLLKGEVSQSYRKARVGEDTIETPKSDRAFKIRIGLQQDRYTSTLEYSKVGPHFETTGGFSSQDLESIQMDNNFFLPGGFVFSPYVTLNRDNLKGLKETTSKQINPGTSLSWTLQDSLTLTAGWDSRKEYTSDKSSSNTTNTWNIGLVKAFKTITAAINYAIALVRDHVSPDQERDSHAISITLNGNFDFGETIVSWNLGNQININKDFTTNKKDLLLTPFAGIRLRFSNGFDVAGNISLSDNDFYINENDTLIKQYNFTISQNIKEWLTASLNYTQNDNNLSDENNDYFEKKLTVKFMCRF